MKVLLKVSLCILDVNKRTAKKSERTMINQIHHGIDGKNTHSKNPDGWGGVGF